MHQAPSTALRRALTLLRIFIAAIFIIHAVVRILNGTIGRFGGFLEAHGFVQGVRLVWGITVFEIGGGTLLALGFFRKWLAAGFILLLLIGIVVIHAENGWFVGEHGTGGIEYSAVLIVALLVIAADEPPALAASAPNGASSR